MKISRIVFPAFMLLLCLLPSCNNNSRLSNRKIALRTLNSEYCKDTIVVSEKLPLMDTKTTCQHSIKIPHKKSGIETIYTDICLKEEYRIIPLETTEESMIGEVTDLFTDDSLIFIYDGWHEYVLVFDYAGKFRNRIGQKGHARNEYESITHAALDQLNKRVCIVDRDSQKILFYDYKGNFLDCEPRYFWFSHIGFFGDKRITLTLPYPHSDYSALNNFKLTVTDNQGRPICGVLKDPGYPKFSAGVDKFSAMLERPLHSAPDGVYYIDILSPDTIWRICDEECVPFVAIDFGEPFTTPQTYREMTTDGLVKRRNQVPHVNDDFVFSKHFGYVSFGDCAIIDLETNNFLAGRIGRRGRVPWKNFYVLAFESNPNEEMFLFDWESDQFAKVWNADEAIRRVKLIKANGGGEELYQTWPQTDREILERLSPEDNPLVIVGSFKKFNK